MKGDTHTHTHGEEHTPTFRAARQPSEQCQQWFIRTEVIFQV